MGERLRKFHIVSALAVLCVVQFAQADEFYTFGAPLCGYGQYRLNSECYEYGSENADAQCMGQTITGTTCLNVVVQVMERERPELYPFDAGFSDVGYATDTVSNVSAACSGNGVTGTTCLNTVVQVIENERPELYPFDAGFSDVGYSITNYATAQESDCLGTMDGYYTMDISAFTTMTDAKCASGYERYNILNDCQYIDMASTNPSDIHSPLNPENWMCGVLCDSGLVYTGTGACSHYCNLDGINKRLYTNRNGNVISYPLYTEKLTTPALNVAFDVSDDDVPSMCYMNLLTDDGTSGFKVKTGNTVYRGSH